MDTSPQSKTIYGWNFRGFNYLEVPLEGTTFVVGDNSSGKSSVLHLVNSVLSDELESLPSLNEDLSVSRYDYFSPYLNYDDVTLGFEFEYEEHRVAKLVTVKRRSHTDPVVTKCSHFSDGSFATLKTHGSRIRKRLTYVDHNEAMASLFELHHKSTGFKDVTKGTSNTTRPNHPLAMIESFEQETLKKNNFFFVLAQWLPTLRHIAPVRGLPEKSYDITRTISSSGSHFAVMWRDLESQKSRDLFKKVSKFGEESGLFDKIEVRPASKNIRDSPLFVIVHKNGSEFFLNQVGVGISQVVPIIVESIYATLKSESHVALFQQPELHLHPVAQAALGSLFYQLSKEGFVSVTETHSSYMMDRFRSDYRSDNFKGDSRSPVKILFCENTVEGNVVRRIDVADDGTLLDPPEKYFSFFLEEIERTMF